MQDATFTTLQTLRSGRDTRHSWHYTLHFTPLTTLYSALYQIYIEISNYCSYMMLHAHDVSTCFFTFSFHNTHIWEKQVKISLVFGVRHDFWTTGHLWQTKSYHTAAAKSMYKWSRESWPSCFHFVIYIESTSCGLEKSVGISTSI